MAKVFKMRLPMGDSPEFPNHCVQCYSVDPKSQVKAAFTGQLNRKFIEECALLVPICSSCLWRYRVNQALFTILTAAPLVAAFAVGLGYDYLQGQVSIRLRVTIAVAIALPLVAINVTVWRMLLPSAVQLSEKANGKEVLYQFTNEHFAKKAAELNGSNMTEGIS